MSFTRAEWSRDFLLALGNLGPDQATIDWVVGWTVHETTTDSGALYNLLNTTQHAPGSTTFNSVGVQNFVSYTQGVQTNAEVLHQNFAGYAQLAIALITNNAAALNPPEAAVQQGLNTWCGGCGYGAVFAETGSQHRDDTFTYGGVPVFIPDGWNDDGTTLTAPNGVSLSTGMRSFVMDRPWWPPENVPLAPEHEADPLDSANLALGNGTRVDFLYWSVGWARATNATGFLQVNKEPPPPAGEPLADAARAALKAWLAA